MAFGGNTGFGAGGFGKPTAGFGATANGFGKQGFGATPTTGFNKPGAMGGFGAPKTTGFGATSPGGFGSPKPNAFGATSPGFGQGAAKPGFGAATGGFGAPKTSFGATGGGFGATKAGFGATGGFGANSMQQQQMQQQQMQQMQQMQAGGIAMPAEYVVMRHQDERDEIIRRFNHVQAMWGKGTYFLSSAPEQNFQTVAVNPNNTYNAFKGIVYNLLPDSGDREGRVGLLLNGDYEQIKNNAGAIEAHLQHQVFKGFLPTSTDVKVDTVHLVQDKKVEVLFQVLDSSNKPVPASAIDKHLSNAYKSTAVAAKPALGGFGKTSPGRTPGFGGGFGKTTGFGATSPGFGAAQANPQAESIKKALMALGCHSEYSAEKQEFVVKGFYPIVSRTKEQLADALLQPEGVPSELWEYARKANPDPNKFCPVPVFGFDSLARRQQIQDDQIELQHKRVEGDFQESLRETVSKIESKQAFLKSKVEELNRNGKSLAKRVLKLMRSASRFDHTGTIQDYKLIQSRVETLNTNINQLKRQKMTDLQAQLEMDSSSGNGGVVQSTLAAPVVAQVMEHLELQQNGVQFLLKTLKEDLAKLEVMEQGYRQVYPTR
eukprot:m.180551 g.180551  ORF g.180551 m.180551 type:complete len:602 (-) comp16855_c0_seq4:571-2376(-)